MLSIIDAVKASSGCSRPLRSGEELLTSGMVVSVGKKEKNNDIVHVQALVLRTSGSSSKHPANVEMWIDMSKEYGERLLRDNELTKECDCPAGTSEKCKHILAVMLYLTRVEESELEDLSCTDIEQQWGALKAATLKEYEAKPLLEMCHVKSQRDIYVKTIPEVTEEMENRWRTNLLKSAPNSEYAMFTSLLRKGAGTVNNDQIESDQKVDNITSVTGLLTFRTWRIMSVLKKNTEEKLQTCESDVIDFYKRHVALTSEESIRVLCIEQGTESWHIARKVRQTASKARAQCTYYFNPNANWDKRYQEIFHSSFVGNEDTYRGLRCESLVRDMYAEILGCTILQTGLLVRTELPWLCASLDGTVIDADGNYIRNIEIKTLKEGTRLTGVELIEMNAIRSLDENHHVKKKTSHYAQMQLGMLLSGMTECDYLVYSEIGNDFVKIPVLFDEDHILEICQCLINVYFEKLLPRIVADYRSNENLNV